MKKVIFILIIILTVPVFAAAENIIFELKGSYFFPSDKDFRGIYGSGFMYGAELTIGVHKGFSVWLGVNFFRKNGDLPFSQEETSLNNSLFGGGLRYNFYSGKRIDIYGGIGAYNFHSNESDLIGNVTSLIGNITTSSVGPVGKLGVNIYITDKLLFDLFIEYSYNKVKPSVFGDNIGGIAAGMGLGYQF
jgi:hypothetical protein